MTINWDDFDEKLKNVKFPYVLIYNFFNTILSIEDRYASTILRYIIKHNIFIFIKNPFYLLACKLPNHIYPETIDSLLTFYDLLKQRDSLFFHIKKWKYVYVNKRFWDKNIKEQIDELIKIKTQINGIFDTSKGGVSFTFKMMPILQSNVNNERKHIIENTIQRLRKVYLLLGHTFFLGANIPVITNEEFENLENDAMFKYTNLVHLKSIQLLEITISLFENFHMTNLQLDNLVNPCFINIEEEITSVNENDDIEDLKMLF